jgi:hypothetical protein
MKLKIVNITDMVYNNKTGAMDLVPTKFNTTKLYSSVNTLVISFGYPLNNMINIFVR